MSFPLSLKTPVLEKKGLEVAAIPSELPAGQPAWSLESLDEHVAVVSNELASTYATVGEVVVSNPLNGRFARVALFSIEAEVLKSYRERLSKTAGRVRSGKLFSLTSLIV